MIETARMLTLPGFSDPVSSLTHLAGALLFAFLAFGLLRRRQENRVHLISLYVFAVSCVLLLALSGVYHLLAPDTAGRAVLKRLDHAAIFVLIAGSFTPVHTILFQGAWRWGMLAAVWGAALLGVVLKTVYFDTVPE
jgi:channel protein (hemolysin III family)